MSLQWAISSSIPLLEALYHRSLLFPDLQPERHLGHRSIQAGDLVTALCDSALRRSLVSSARVCSALWRNRVCRSYAISLVRGLGSGEADFPCYRTPCSCPGLLDLVSAVPLFG